ncbi:class D sortase [Ruminococcaceae bacterium OttesenSCG-928-L11]|nr:class D sortase [Ruminococcaceae bacterium OttesenSCG-928-L11]
MNRLKAIWLIHSRWLAAGGAVCLILLVALAVQASKPEPRTVAALPAETEVTFDLDSNKVYSADDGVIVIPADETPLSREEAPLRQAASVITNAPVAVSQTDTVVGSSDYTLPEQAQLADGSIGQLSIPKLGLTVGVFESDSEMEAMTKGIAHFKTTSAWSGNIGLCSHNINFDLTDGYFKQLHTLSEGDNITYKTALGERTYTVSTVAEIPASDWSYLGRTDDNRITMITCISGKPDARLVVQAAEKS